MPVMYKYLVLGVLFSFAFGERTKDKMYDSIDGISACFRRLNGTHQIGCSSNRDGSTGIIHFVEVKTDLDFVLRVDNGLDYIPAIPISLFQRELSDKLQSLSHISGLLIYDVENSTNVLNSFSPDLKCPNEGSNAEGTCSKEWNPAGNSFLTENFKFPVFYLDKPKEIKKVRDCFVKFNNFSFDQHAERSVCSIELQSFMFAAYDTPTCLRRSQSLVNMNPVKFCDSMGDQNIWASLFPMGNSSLTPESNLKTDIKQILVVSRIDATSLFYNLEPGAQTAVTGMVTLLSVAELLKRMLPKYEGYDRNVVFILFNGESFDYIGSQRIVYDMQHGAYPRPEFTTDDEHSTPIRFEDIDTVLEISQLRKTDKLHVHLLNSSEQQAFTDILRTHLKVEVEVHEGVVPPTSIQSFLREKNAPKSLVLTDYATSFTNSFYNSINDTVENIDFVYHEMTGEEDVKVLPEDSLQVFLGGVVDGIAKSLYQAVTKKEYDGGQEANLYYINELLHCYLESANCSINRAIQKGSFQDVPLYLYVSVTTSPNIVTKLMALTLAFFLGDQVGDGPCSPNITSHIYYHFNMSKSVASRNETQCFRISMNFTDAESPAFLIDGYDWTSGQYSTWTESVWRDFNVRLFLKPARSHEIMTLLVGIFVFALSLGITYCVNRKKDVLFEEIPTATPPANC